MAYRAWASVTREQRALNSPKLPAFANGWSDLIAAPNLIVVPRQRPDGEEQAFGPEQVVPCLSTGFAVPIAGHRPLPGDRNKDV